MKRSPRPTWHRSQRRLARFGSLKRKAISFGANASRRVTRDIRQTYVMTNEYGSCHCLQWHFEPQYGASQHPASLIIIICFPFNGVWSNLFFFLPHTLLHEVFLIGLGRSTNSHTDIERYSQSISPGQN